MELKSLVFILILWKALIFTADACMAKNKTPDVPPPVEEDPEPEEAKPNKPKETKAPKATTEASVNPEEKPDPPGESQRNPNAPVKDSELEPIESVVFGEFEMTSDPNNTDYINYLTTMGYDLIFISIAKTTKPQLELTEYEDGEFGLKVGTELIKTSAKFKNGVQFDDKLQDGRICKDTITLKGNKMIQLLRVGDVEASITNEMDDEGFTSTILCENIKAVMKYERID